ncbi:MAG: class II fumarate hydratase [Bacteroidales bacterium]|nr:class II fumarate hydratase [Bacteroidales bacterium]
MNKLRKEKDSLGIVEVPANAYWGAQTQRSKDNFKIGENQMPKEIIHSFAIVKKACALINNELNLLPKVKADLISLVCDEICSGKLADQFPLVVWQTGSGTQTNMNVNEVISNRAHEISGGSLLDDKKSIHPNDDVNMSQSSNDTFPTAMNIAAYTMLVKHTIPALKKLKEAFEVKSKKFSNVVKSGRTHLMDATPITLGQEFSGYVSQIEHGISAIEKTLLHLSEIPIGGTAVGTGLNAPKDFDIKVAKKIADLTKLPFISSKNKFEALSAHDAIVEASGALKTMAVSLMHIANNIRLLASGPRCGISEITLPANEPGSSIMPGKVNPTQCEALSMVCAQVIGCDAAITVGGMQGHFQLNVFMPVMIYNFLLAARLIGDACISFNEKCVCGIEANMENINKNMNNSLMLVTALNTHIGYDKAAQIAKYAHENNTTLREAAIKLNLVQPDDFDKWVNPNEMI